jgi:uncharacterized membrane protein YbhN (UPF0104 family)
VLSRKRRLIALARVAVAALIFAYLFSRIPLAEVGRILARAAPEWVLMAVVTALGSQWLVAERLRRLVGSLGSSASTLSLFQINLAAVFYGLLLPAGNFTGVLARFYQISRRDRAYAATLVALALERLVATTTLCVIGIAFWLLERPAGSWPALVLMSGALAPLLALHLLWATDLRLAVRLRAPVSAWWPQRLASLGEALGRSRRLPWSLLAQVFALGILIHLAGTLAFAMIAAALQLPLSLPTIGWTRSAALLVTVLPVSLAGLGLREGTFVLLLTPYAVSAADALSYSLLAFAATILGVGLLGGVLEAARLLR